MISQSDITLVHIAVADLGEGGSGGNCYCKLSNTLLIKLTYPHTMTLLYDSPSRSEQRLGGKKLHFFVYLSSYKKLL